MPSYFMHKKEHAMKNNYLLLSILLSLSSSLLAAKPYVILKHAINNSEKKILLYKAPFGAAYTYQRPFSWLRPGQERNFDVALYHNLYLKINTNLKDLNFATLKCLYDNNHIVCQLLSPIYDGSVFIIAQTSLDMNRSPAKSYRLSIEFKGKNLENTTLRLIPRNCHKK